MSKQRNKPALKQIGIETMLYRLTEMSISISIVVLTQISIAVLTCCRIAVMKCRNISAGKHRNGSANQ